MDRLKFSLADYQNGLVSNNFRAPKLLCPYFDVDPVLYNKYLREKRRGSDLDVAIEEIKKRTGSEYFWKIWPLQARTLDYSSNTFPAYRFILPEVMTEDWLAIVDWGKFQRDHVLHQPLTGYTILKLLDDTDDNSRYLPNGKSILETCVDSILHSSKTNYIREFLTQCGMKDTDRLFNPSNCIARTIWRLFFVEAAYIAAVFHDLGYPWQFAERIQSNLGRMNSPALRQNRSAKEITEQYKHRLLFHAINGYQKLDKACPSNWENKVVEIVDLALSKTHGLPGALGFLHLNDCIRKYPSDQSAMRLLCVEWAATAILMHDMCGAIYWGNSENGVPERPFLRLSFDVDPLSAIVTLADVIEEFERPVVSFGSSLSGSKEFVTLSYETSCSSTEFFVAGNELELKFVMSDKQCLAKKLSFLDKDRRAYFDYQYGYLDMSSIGITNVKLAASVK